MTRILHLFATRHLLSNLIVALVTAGGLFAWHDIRKEELPDFTFDMVSISTALPGAAPAEVEQSITLPMEHELADLEYIRRIMSSSKRGSSIITLELQRGLASPEVVVSEIRNRLQSVRLPTEVEDPPVVRHRKTSQKAVIDVALYFNDQPLLDLQQRRELQQVMRQLENRLLQHSEISQIERDAWLAEEIQIRPRMGDLLRYQLNLRELREGILEHHTTLPLGVMESRQHEQVRLDGRLETPAAFADIPLRSAFTGEAVHLSDVASAHWAFADSHTLVRINGHEGVIFNVVKSSQTGILDAVDLVKREVAAFQKIHQPNSLRIALLDDESWSVRNRLDLIASNALIGFALIIIVLTVFLNPKAALWVTMGIPFSFFFVLTTAWLLDYTVNNLTLAAVIIAMGMLVDDAIVVSENISRKLRAGQDPVTAAVEGTREVLTPILASVATTIAAFLPLMAFEGRLALLTTTIPPIVALILTGSLIESLIILPGHLSLQWRWPGTRRLPEGPDHSRSAMAAHWFDAIEKIYVAFIFRLLHYRIWILLGFALFCLTGFFLYRSLMSFALFPREQVATMFVIGEADSSLDRYQTLALTKPIEAFFLPRVGRELIGLRTTVGYRRYRPSDEENVVSVRIELDEGRLSGSDTNQIVADTRAFLKTVPGFKKLRLSTQMFGSDTGSALEILILAEQDGDRQKAAALLLQSLRELPDIGYVEIDEPASKMEYRIIPRRDMMERLQISPAEVEMTMRSALAGVLLYRFYAEREEIAVRLRFDPAMRAGIDSLLAIPAANRNNFQVSLHHVVAARRETAVSEIQRLNQQRILRINADIKSGSSVTPLAMARRLESTVFPAVNAALPAVHFDFDGEVKNARESSSFFQTAVIFVILLIFTILAVQFNSLTRPLVIMIAIVPAWMAIVFVFLAHGIPVYGFFAVVGALGLSGIVVNGAILLLDRIDRAMVPADSKEHLFEQIAHLSVKRLQAVFLTTLTTVAGLLPTAYGLAGYDSMLAEMMLVLSWGLIFAMSVTLVLIPVIISYEYQLRYRIKS
ncbi:MAG: efflux RND transporter permease subunit [Leptospiraceae bacterium]|nr:efflux RND transporter permease subunit [Leptospiraceae bacterium]